MDLFTYYRSTSSYRVRIALAMKGLDFNAIAVNLAQGDHQCAEYQAINPQGRVPLLRLGNGVLISQSTAIIEYLDEHYPEPALLSADPEVRAAQRAVAALIACDIHPLHNVAVLDRLRDMGHDEHEVSAWIGHWISQGLGAVESMIGDDGFCFGELPCMADVYLLPQLYAARRFKADLSQYPRLRRVEQLAQAHGAFRQAHPDAQPDKPE